MPQLKALTNTVEVNFCDTLFHIKYKPNFMTGEVEKQMNNAMNNRKDGEEPDAETLQFYVDTIGNAIVSWDVDDYEATPEGLQLMVDEGWGLFLSAAFIMMVEGVVPPKLKETSSTNT
jgi:hypothetical protein